MMAPCSRSAASVVPPCALPVPSMPHRLTAAARFGHENIVRVRARSFRDAERMTAVPLERPWERTTTVDHRPRARPLARHRQRDERRRRPVCLPAREREGGAGVLPVDKHRNGVEPRMGAEAPGSPRRGAKCLGGSAPRWVSRSARQGGALAFLAGRRISVRGSWARTMHPGIGSRRQGSRCGSGWFGGHHGGGDWHIVRPGAG